MLSQLISQPCTLRLRGSATPGEVDDYGDEPADADSFTDVSTVCALQQRRRDEQGDQGELSDTSWVAFFTAEESMGDKPSGNQLVLDGVTYEFTGNPWHAFNPRSQTYSHWEATVRAAG